MSILVRAARAEDVPAISTVLIASITQLCARDHGGDPARIAAWTANKTPDGITDMLAWDGLHMFVAELEGEVSAVGATTAHGEIVLNYVAPPARFRGVSKALLAHMEADLLARGFAEGRLKSTATALDFYRSRGWVAVEGSRSGRFIDSVAMRKALGG